MVKITITGKNSSQIIDIVQDLKQSKYELGKDFDYFYHPGHFDYTKGNVPTRTEFVFYNEKIATFFSLRFSS